MYTTASAESNSEHYAGRDAQRDVRRVVAAIDLPLLADADTGYGTHLNVLRTVRDLEAAGVAAIVIEDQVS